MKDLLGAFDKAVDPQKVPFFWRREITVLKETLAHSCCDLQRLREATERKRVSGVET